VIWRDQAYESSEIVLNSHRIRITSLFFTLADEMADKPILLQFCQSVDWNAHLNDATVADHVRSIKTRVESTTPGGAAAAVAAPSGTGQPERVKLVVVGDGAVGKTSLLIRYATNNFPTDYLPTVFDNHTAHMKRDNGSTINLHLWDTAGQEDYDRLRPLSYPGADAILLCFSTVNQASYDAIREKWAPEVQHYIPNVPHILIGTKTDLRDAKTPDPNSGKFEPLTPENGQVMAKEIRAVKYMEICSKTGEGVSAVFEEAVNLVLRERSAAEAPAAAAGSATPVIGSTSRNKKKGCVLM